MSSLSTRIHSGLPYSRLNDVRRVPYSQLNDVRRVPYSRLNDVRWGGVLPEMMNLRDSNLMGYYSVDALIGSISLSMSVWDPNL